MNAITIIAAINAGLALVEALMPLVEKLKNDGEISVESQAELAAKFQSLKDKADGQFGGPEWEVTP